MRASHIYIIYCNFFNRKIYVDMNIEEEDIQGRKTKYLEEL